MQTTTATPINNSATQEQLDAHVRAIVQWHFSPETGCPFWLDWAKKAGASVALTRDPFEAVADADAVVTDCWVSMGDEDEGRRHNLLRPYQVNAKLMAAAGRDAIFMHCLPAHRGEEVTDEVMDGPQSVVFDEAENRLHAQKGILAWCLGAVQE